MKFASIGSSSKGNCTVVSTHSTSLLVDCGFSLKQTIDRLERLNIKPQDIDAILVTHEHDDHWSGVRALCKKYKIPIYLSAGTYRAVYDESLEFVNIVNPEVPFIVGDFRILGITVPHDALEPLQYVFEANSLKFGVLTDLGHLTPHIFEHYGGLDALLLEANHDELMLAEGMYPSFLKARISGRWGHLSNRQAIDFVSKIDQTRLQHVLFGHMSDRNNCQEALENLVKKQSGILSKVHYANYEYGSDWIEII
tara:strand:- start:23545 stop:24303 length:759 start_codon:yes stop_codon:yes gene_type:complete